MRKNAFLMLLPLVLLYAFGCETNDSLIEPEAAPTTQIANSTGCTVGFTGTTNPTTGHTSHGNSFTACTSGTLTGIELEYGDSPCTKSFTATTLSTADHAAHGNSFAPCATGEVTSIEIEYWGTAAPGRTLRIYQGGSPIGTPIYTQTGILLDGGEDFDVITLTGSVTLQKSQLYTFTVDAPSPVRYACGVGGSVGMFIGASAFPTCGIGHRIHTTTADATGLTLSLFNGNTVSGPPAYTQSGVTLDGGYGFDPITLSTPFPVTNGSQYTFLLDAPAPVGYACGVSNGESAYFSDNQNSSCNVGYRAHFAPTVTTQGVAVDVQPDGCPNVLAVKGKGVFPVAILGTESFDVETVDPAAVLLEGVAPLRWDWTDVATPYSGPVTDHTTCTDEIGGDGYGDLFLVFDRPQLVAALGEVGDGDVLELELTGNLKEEFGGTPFEGSDYVRIVKKGR